MITLGPTDSVNAGATTAATVNCVIEGQTITAGSPPASASFGVLHTGQLGNSVVSLYSPGAGNEALISRVALFNTGGSAQTVTWAENGTTSAHYTATIQLVANGWAEYEPGSGWTMYSANGTVVEGISEITSEAGSVTVTDPGGPVTNLEAAQPVWIFGDGRDGPLVFTATPRTITDGVTTRGSSVITSATAHFTSVDIGLVLDDTAGLGSIPPSTRVKSVTNTTTAVMTAPASDNAGVSDTVIIGGAQFGPGSYSSITIPTGATVIPNNPGYGNLLCSGEYFVDGTINQAGEGASTNPGGTGTGTDGVAIWPPLGGNGGAGSTSTVGDTPGGIVSPTRGGNSIPSQVAFGLFTATPNGTNFAGAAGGGDGVNLGGDGGNGGQFFAIFANSIVHGPNATYNIKGQDGGNAPAGNCGGGGGGPDGWWVTVSNVLIGAPAIIGGGGAGGLGHGTGTNGTAGQPGFGTHYTPGSIIIQTP